MVSDPNFINSSNSLPDLNSLIRQQAQLYLSPAITVTNISIGASNKDSSVLQVSISYDFNRGMWQDTVDILTPIYDELATREGYTPPTVRDVALPRGVSEDQLY